MDESERWLRQRNRRILDLELQGYAHSIQTQIQISFLAFADDPQRNYVLLQTAESPMML
jgi:hypothetical protein